MISTQKKNAFSHPAILLLSIWFGPIALLNLSYSLSKGSEFSGDIWFVVATSSISMCGSVGLFLLKNWGRKSIFIVLIMNAIYCIYIISSLLIKAIPSDDLRAMGYPGIVSAVLVMLSILVFLGVCFVYLNKPSVKAIFR